MSDSRLLILEAASPIHAGASGSDGIVDMPVQREGSTSIPKIDSSIFKGGLKDAFIKLLYNKDIEILFSRKEVGGQLSFTDLKLLFFPVKSSSNIFSLISCPYIMERFFEETITYNLEMKDLRNFCAECQYVNNNEALVTNASEKNIYLENYLFKTRKLEFSDSFINALGINNLSDKITIISNENFIDFVNYYTQVAVRTRINKSNGITERSNLFTKEYIPDEAIFYGIINRFSDINCDEPGKNAFKKICKLLIDKEITKLQFGGDYSLGKGVMKIVHLGGGDQYE